LEFGRYNVIYGWNGTGKTTLSRILRCLEKRTKPGGHVTLKLDGQEVSGEKFQTREVPIRVFNRDFVNENVFPVGGGDLPPIFVLGAESVEKQKELERLKGERATAQSRLESARSTKQRAEKDFSQFCIDQAKLIKETLRSSGQNPYNNYDKSDFCEEAEKMAAAGDGTAHRLSDEEREKLLTQHRATPKPKVQEVSYTLPDFDAILKKLSGLLTETVVSALMEALKDDHPLSEWIRQGLTLHRERQAKRCLFCEQQLPEERLARLEAHFSDQYEAFVKKIDSSIVELEEMGRQAAQLRLPNKAELYDDLEPEFQTAETGLRETLKAAQSFLEAAVQALTEKKRRLFEHVNPELQAPAVDAEVVEKLNAVIRKHNQACDDFQKRVGEARKRLARGMIAAELEEFVRRRDAIEHAKAALQAAEQEVKRLDDEIARLEREIIEHRQPAEELNEDLCKYLGHSELQLQIKETGYTITRGGVPANALSEGEMTAIALLYFLKALEDKGFDLENGIVVLDDPVSSLDASALYMAYGFIRQRVEKAGQVFIFTHNFTFFRQVRNWFHHLPGQNKKDASKRPARFYMLECLLSHGQRCASIRRLDPLLEEFESEYQYVFACIYRAVSAATSAGASLEEHYHLPNMARRLLEAFLAFRQPATPGDLWQKMKAATFEQAKKTRILRFLHTYSHGDAIGDPQHDPSLLAEAGSVLRDLLEFIESQDKVHYDHMVKLVTAEAVDDNDSPASA